MIKKLPNLFLYCLLFCASFLVTEKLEVFSNLARSTFILYEPNIGISQTQFDMVSRYFGFKKVRTAYRKVDSNYRTLSRLNDNNLIQNLYLNCNPKAHTLEQYPSKYVKIIRRKKFGYAVIEFTTPLNEYAECILFQYNKVLKVEYYTYLEAEKDKLQEISQALINTNISNTIISKMFLIDTLMLLQPPEYERYHYWELSRSDVHESTVIRSISFAALLMVILFLIIVLFRKVSND